MINKIRLAPKGIQVALLLVLFFVVINIVTLVLILVHHDTIGRSVPNVYDLSGASPDKVNQIVNYFVYGGATVHILLSALGIWLSYKVLQAKAWARKRLTVLLAISAVISFYMFTHLMAGTPELLVHIVSDLVKFSAIYFLWAPNSSRDFFSRSAYM